jgi:thioredoxin-like negative regulator of GroEL
MIINIKDKDEFMKLKKGETIVKFGAPWCGPCKSVDGLLDTLSLDTIANILKVNVDENPDIAGDFKIMSIPVVILFDAEGNEIRRSNGFKPGELQEIIDLTK